MNHVINIHNRGHHIDFEIGKYKIDVLGGWGVELGQFSMSLKHSQSGQTVNCEQSFWPMQYYVFEKRAKRIFIAKIKQPGIYKVEFINPETIKVRPTNLFFVGHFQEPIPNEEVSIFIH
jgi:hypothetical protein